MFRFRRLRKALVNLALSPLTRAHRARVGRYILDRALNENNCRPDKNGEYHLMARVKNRLRAKDAIVVDVGAYIGDWTLAFGKGMSAPLSIYSFEPCSETFQMLRRKLEGFKDGPSVTAVNSAVSDRNGSAELQMSKLKPFLNSLVPRPGLHQSVEQVSVVRGDTFCEKNGVDNLDFLKIDTEGHDMDALRGFDSMIADGRIGFIQFEYNCMWLDARGFLADVFDLLLPKGYVMGKIFPRGVQFFDTYSREIETFQYANYVAMRPHWVDAFKKVV